MIDEHSQKMLWLKCSINNKAETAYDLILKDAQENVTPLQVRGDMGVENKILAKHMILMRNSTHNGFIGARYVYNTRIDRFWREHNTTVKDHVLE